MLWQIIKILPKKGDPRICGNNRTICLHEAFKKLWAKMKLFRWSKHIEDSGILGNTQFGFRPNTGRDEPIFILLQCIDDYWFTESKPLYIWFIDLKKAFDRVPRSILFLICEKAGIGGNSLQFLKNLYTGVTAKIGVNGDLSDKFINKNA